MATRAREVASVLPSSRRSTFWSSAESARRFSNSTVSDTASADWFRTDGHEFLHGRVEGFTKHGRRRERRRGVVLDLPRILVNDCPVVQRLRSLGPTNRPLHLATAGHVARRETESAGHEILVQHGKARSQARNVKRGLHRH